MDSNVQACAECTRSCMSLHKAKLDPYPIVCSFFKVMFGKQFSEELIVPPKFAKTLKSLVGKKTYLEDSTAQKWDVKLSKVKGSVVIQQGWQEFSVDHGIEIGDFVVFHYIRGSHFIVQIFTRSGCERPTLFCEKNYQNKRIKATRDFAARGDSDGTCNNIEFPPKFCSASQKVAERDSVQRQDNVRKSLVLAEDCAIEGSTRKRPKVSPADDFVVEPYVRSSRNTSLSREDDRDYLFDLSAFEMPSKNVRTDEADDRDSLLDLSTFEMPADKVNTNETSIVEVNKCTQGLNKLENAQIVTASVDVEEWQIAETVPLLASNAACLTREEPNLLLKSSLDIDVPSDSDLPQGVVTPIAYQFPAAAPIFQLPGATTRIVKKEPPPCQNDNDYWVAHSSRNVPGDSLEDPATNNGGLCNLDDKVAIDEDFLERTVKPEPADSCDSTSADAVKITCFVEQDGEPFLVSSALMPLSPCLY
ncbi:hypothetical protein RND81_05G233600 [Saponaria officinalis]|uniref:TF-B3 domain-containing protein n=1 Tax=Saponaria officinalis TaxID=3572 RepID=A0AAW1L1I6_SAPOF